MASRAKGDGRWQSNRVTGKTVGRRKVMPYSHVGIYIACEVNLLLQV